MDFLLFEDLGLLNWFIFYQGGCDQMCHVVGDDMVNAPAHKVQCSCNDTYQLVKQPGEDFATQCVPNEAARTSCDGPYNFQCASDGR